MKWIRKCIGILILIAGLSVLLYPDMNDAYISFQEQKAMDEYAISSENMDENILLKEVMKYNTDIFENNQEMLCSENEKVNPIQDIEKDMYGTIEIERMNIKIPLYIGTSDQHLQNGAAIMGETSIPIDQNNTNSVICAHRGWYGHPFFRDIELLVAGDVVKLSTPFGELDYCVKETKIVSPYDQESILIQTGKKMITLSTCHPYGNASLSSRYLVYCELMEKDEKISETPVEVEEHKISVTTQSQAQIFMEIWGRRIILLLAAVLLFLLRK